MTTEPAPEVRSTRLGRRGLLAAASIPAALAATALTTRPAHAADPGLGLSTVSTSTLAELRALTDPPASGYLLTEPGMEGLFVPDPADTTTPDNTGTVLVTAAGARLKRLHDGSINVRWFGAKGDQTTDDTAAIQAALIWAQSQREAVLYLPAGRYVISSALETKVSPALHLYGDGANQSWLLVSADADRIDSIFAFTSTTALSRYDFHDFSVVSLVPDKFDHVIKVPEMKYSRFANIWFTRAMGAAVSIGRGWQNLFHNVTAHSGGAGLQFGPNEVNVLRVEDCDFRNNRVGIELNTGRMQQVRFSGCTFEGNQTMGLHVDADVKNLSITECYFEHNNKALPDSYESISHIVIEPNRAAGPIEISNNHVWILNTDPRPAEFVRAHSAQGGLRLWGNHPRVANRTGLKSALLRTSADPAHESGVGPVTIGGTYRETFNFPYEDVVADALAAGRSRLHEASVEGTVRTNWAPEITAFTAQSNSTNRLKRRKLGQFRGREVLILTDGSTDNPFGFEIDLADHPELAGKLVYFACSVKATDGAAVGLWTSQLGAQTPAAVGTAWTTISYVDRLPNTGAVSFGIVMEPDVDNGSVSVSHPVLSEVGRPYADH